MRPPTVAIVTTLRDADLVLESFVRYHLAIGFDHLFLFFDDSQDPSFPRVASRGSVTAIKNDASLRQRWVQSRLHRRDPRLMGFIDREVMARQALNAGVAIELAMEKKIDWLLHLDIDELFFSPTQSVRSHFAELSAENIDQITYRNCEAIPQRADVGDYFREVTIFKRPPAALAGGSLTAHQMELIRSIPQLSDSFFLFYGNGKSAARVTRDLIPNGVHAFHSAAARSRDTTSTDPLILHYPCCGFEHFWRKYRTLGDFADQWFDTIDIARCGNAFHLEARDVVAGNDRSAAFDFFNKRVVIKDEPTIEKLLVSGLCCVIDEPARLLAKVAINASRA